tara:strand:- start:2005 stop:3429 length:1425 start_codon:yes stop_codon:yes gene_type:complete
MINLKNLILQNQNQNILSIIYSAGELGQKENTEVYVVGGFVRDLIMKNPINDIDIMVVGDGIAFAEKLAGKLGIKKIVPFKKFGTAIIPNKKLPIEIATARTEKYNDKSRKPSKISYAKLNGDLLRRDFTINAMAMDIHSSRFGDLTDPFGGISDIEKQIIKTPLSPDDTFSEDPLRMMRAAYFSSKLGFTIDNNCFNAVKRQSKRIKIVSAERIRDEFIKILETNKPSIGITILQTTGLLKLVFPEIDIMYGMEQTSEWHHKDIFDHTMQVVDNAAKLSQKMELRFAALVHDIAKPNTRRVDKNKGYTFHGHDAIGEKMINNVAVRMRLPNNLKFFLKKLTLLHLRPIALVKDIVTDSAVRRLMVLAGDDLNDLMTLCRADITTKNPNKVKRYLNNFKKVEEKMKNVLKLDTMKAFQSPVRGKEIMSICQIPESKTVGEIKSAIEDAILEGEIDNTYEASLNYLMKIKHNYLD